MRSSSSASLGRGGGRLFEALCVDRVLLACWTCAILFPSSLKSGASNALMLRREPPVDRSMALSGRWRSEVAVGQVRGRHPAVVAGDAVLDS